jgi:hypothetical protein
MPGTVHLNSTADINTYVELANRAGGNGRSKINPEMFYTKQLLDTIRYDADQYVYYRLADETPIQDKADKLQMRRWAPLQAHTVPLTEGMPPVSDKGSVEEYTMQAFQYGRYMEFTDKVDFAVIDPVIAHYTKEYSLVAMETFDMLARECLFGIANKYYANAARNFEALTVDSTPNMTDLRLITLSLKKQLVKPRRNGRYHVIGSPEFFYDMISDPTVQAYMTINQTTKTMYDNGKLVPMFDMEFYETLCVPTSSEFVKNGVINKRLYRKKSDGSYEYMNMPNDMNGDTNGTYVSKVSTWVKDARTGQDASYIPNQLVWDVDAFSTANKGNGNDWAEFKAQHILVVGKDALVRTGLAGEGQAKVYVKQKGSAGVLDPIDQRQSIGFKINSVGFGSCRTEAVVDYICVPTQVNLI